MKTTYDRAADAVYIEFANVEQAGGYSEKTQGEWPVNVNITLEGTLMGIEFMEASTIFSKEFLDRATKL